MQAQQIAPGGKLMLQQRGPILFLEDIGTYTRPNGEEWSSVRDLYEYLELAPSVFSRWCNSNIQNNAFAIEGIDYEQLNTYVELQNGGEKAVIEYAVHPDFGAKLCMVSRSAKAEEVRNWFLARNKKLAVIEQQAASVVALPQDPDDLILMLAQRNAEHSRELRAIKAEQEAARIERENNQQQLASVEQKIEEVAARQVLTEVEYFAIKGWAKLQKKSVTEEQAKDLGRKASKLSRERGVRVDKLPNGTYGTVNSYHCSILQDIF